MDTSCWTSTPEVAAWLKARSMSGDDGYAYFVKRAADIALAQGRSPVQWSEVYDHFKTKLDKKVKAFLGLSLSLFLFLSFSLSLSFSLCVCVWVCVWVGGWVCGVGG